ncbi:hypothetical protein C8J56DRAFT_1052943 [Mycena floridula]|nr:hypothetical protein C8J56DRAFT_1052943 [Mycena floridula]
MDLQLGTAPPKESNPTIFSSYVREAKIYDSGMVARWKVLMDGLLLFAALFSAVVTAFIIESYKNLSPDLTVVFLYQISQQLSTMTNSTELNLLSLSDFSGSPKLAIITNVFWFLSLALSLTCALTATLIQQWASDYVRAIERREAPEIRARIRAYLFEGVENSNVAVIVEGTPLLLHASLFSFFIGLVFFLHPINTIMTFLTANILAAFGIAYLSATIAPLIDTASPFRTPLTTLILQFSFARNSIRKTSICGLRMASFMRSNAVALVRSCWEAVRKYASSVAEIGQTTTQRLSKLSAWVLSRMSWPSKDHHNTVEMQPSSEIPEELPEAVISAPMKLIRSCLESLEDIWWDDMLSYSPDLDAIKENTALNRYITGFQEREIKALSWTLEHTTNDAELLLILEAIPSYFESRNSWLDCHFEEDNITVATGELDSSTEDSADRLSVLQAVLGDPETGFAVKLNTLISTRQDHKSMTEREAAAVVNALSFLLEKGIHPYTSSTGFIPRRDSWGFRQFRDQVAFDHPSLADATRRLPVMEIFRCSKARHAAALPPIPLITGPFSATFHCSGLLTAPQFGTEILSLSGIEKVSISDTSYSLSTKPGLDHWEENHRGTVLFALCSFFHKEAGYFPGHFAAESFYLAMKELACFISPLCEGSTEAQRAYSAAVWFITLSLEEAGTEAEEARHWRETHHFQQFLWLLLDPLLQVTDDLAVKGVEKVFSHPFLWKYIRPMLGFNSETPSDNSVLCRIMCAHRLANSFGTPTYMNGSRHRMPPSIPKNVTFSNIDSAIQTQLVQDIRDWLREGLPELSSEDTKVIPELFQLLATVDNPDAVTEMQRILHEFLVGSPTPNIDPAQHESNIEAARKALEQLEEMASRSE